jgi:hypothetical protein
MRTVALLALGLGALMLRGGTAPAGSIRPALTDVSISLPAGSTLLTSAIARSRDGLWFAAAERDRLGIYRWSRRRWVLDGAVRLPAELPFPNPGTTLSFTSVTRGGAPDFTAHAYGADTEWFALAAKVRGRWQIVPFDDQYRANDPFTFASGAVHGLIEGIFDASGAASGPTTFQWYRFAGNRFAPTEPPGGAAPCTQGALRAAAHWVRIPGDPLLQHIARRSPPTRFACADGWAVATDGRDMSVYEQNGRHWVKDYRPEEHRWLQVGVGSPRLVSSRIEFAMPRSLLIRLAQQVGVVITRAAREPSGRPWRLSPRQRAPIRLRVRPGETYYPPRTLFEGRSNVLTVTINEPTQGRHAMRFRWRSGAWVRSP